MISADWVSLTAPEGPKPPPPPEGYTSNEGGSGGRLILLVVDQPNIRFGGFFGIRKAVNGFIDRLQPSDRVALVGIGPGAPSVPFTADRERLRKAVELTTGQRQTRVEGLLPDCDFRSDGHPARRRHDAAARPEARVRRSGDGAAERAHAHRDVLPVGRERGQRRSRRSAPSTASRPSTRSATCSRRLRSVNSPNTLVLDHRGLRARRSAPVVHADQRPRRGGAHQHLRA